MAKDHRTWDVHIAELQFALNSVDHDAIGFGTAEIIFNCKIIDLLANSMPSMEISGRTYLHKLELDMERIRRQQNRNIMTREEEKRMSKFETKLW